MNNFIDFLKIDKIGQGYVHEYFHLKGLCPTNIKAELYSTLGKSAPSTIKYWGAEFKQGCTSCKDEHHSGQLIEVDTPEMVKQIHKVVLNDRWLKECSTY